MATAPPQAVVALFNSLTQAPKEHVTELIKALKALPQCNQSSTDTETTTMTAPAAVKKSRSNKNKASTKGPKRPLNSWMAYRKFYNKMLSPRTQKIKSKILTQLWKGDPFEAKWSILAKSYSIVRGDRDKEEVSLDKFLEHCTPLVGIIPPDIYLGFMGWELGEPSGGDQENAPLVVRGSIPDLDKFPEALRTTTLSVEDLVKICVDAKLFGALDSTLFTGSQNGSLAMAVQPTTTAAADTNNASTFPLGAATLASGTAVLGGLDSDIASFDMAGGINNAFNPAEFDANYADGGAWDSFNLDEAILTGLLTDQEVDFASFINSEHII